jgi:hypothetical protein
MRRGFMTGEQEQEQHRHHLVAADASPFLFDAHKLGDQSRGAGLARGFQALLHVAFHGENLRDGEEEAKGAGETREAAVNFGRSARRSPRSSQITESGNLPHSGRRDRRAPLREQLVGQFAGDRQNARPHFKHRLPAKRFVDDAPKAGVIGLVCRQHVVGDRAHDCRHPPPKSDGAAVILSHGEFWPSLNT